LPEIKLKKPYIFGGKMPETAGFSNFMPCRIYIQPAIADARAESKKRHFNSLGLAAKIKSVCLADCYTIDKALDKNQKAKARRLLSNPLFETASESPAVNGPKKFDYVIEIGYLPGVTDNIGQTAKESLEDGLKIKFLPQESVYSSRIFFISFEGKAAVPDAEKIKDCLFNPLIERAGLKTFSEYIKNRGLDMIIPKVRLSAKTTVLNIDLNIEDGELETLGRQGIKDKSGLRRGPLSLSLNYLKAIREHFNGLKRKPTDVELETLAQTWSEHCKHTIFADPMDDLARGIYKTYIKGATEKIRRKKGRRDFCVSVFTDNSGAIGFDKDYLITHKVETHNTPSALDPFGGSITGIVGVNRDCLGFGLGAKPIANVYGFCLADPKDNTELYRDKGKTQKMLSARRILEGVVAGINAGGNQSGIPTNLGFIYFDPRFRGKPLVFAGTVGLIKRSINNRPSHIKRARPGDLIAMIGGRVGADGIHGATFSSVELDEKSPATAVQIGDPITQKKLSDALIKEARDLDLYSSLTDCGAGGLSSAVGEMAEATGGCLVNLEKVPLKYPGLAPWQIWISESQERMVLAIPEKKWPKFSELMGRRGVEATVIGEFNNRGRCTVKFNNENVLDLDMEFLHHGRPEKLQTTKEPKAIPADERLLQKTGAGRQTGYSKEIISLLSHLNIASIEFISKQYDHEVQAGSVIKPLSGRGRIVSEATVTRPVLSSKKGLVLGCALYPGLTELSPYKMAAVAIDGAVRAAVAAGADIDYLALLDNFCWSSSDDPTRLWQLKEAARACYNTACALGTPFISGKDSMYNDFKGFDKDARPLKISIPPTLLISSIGVIPDIAKAVSLEAKMPGDIIYILGNTNNELAGSQYREMLKSETSPNGVNPDQPEEKGVPAVDAKKNYRLYKTLFKAIQKNLVASAISLNRGGLAIAAIKSLSGGGRGGKLDLKNLPGGWNNNHEALFSESAGRILVTVDKKKAPLFEKIMSGRDFARIGQVENSKLVKIYNNNKLVASLALKDALEAYKKPLKNL
jgi:phosphoribosylformylglycinamidine synthase